MTATLSVGRPVNTHSGTGARAVRARTREVTLLRWPHQEADRDRHLGDRRPVLWVVESGATPPPCVDQLEDWVRPPLGQHDVDARVAALARRARDEQIPVIGPGNVLCSRDVRLALADSEAVIMSALVDSFQRVVARRTLIERCWGRADPKHRNALDLRILRLRRRIEPLDLEIVTMWGRGYMLEAAA